MSPRPFHHGNLRAVLLDEAVGVLRESGVDGLSLRDLARRAGVSHGAPRSHFVDRQALLDALAEAGFERLTTAVRRALDSGGGRTERLHRVARAYVDFAVDDAALMELMFQVKATTTPESVHEAAATLFATLDGALGSTAPEAADDESRDHFKMLFAATMQGIAALVASGRIERPLGDRLVGTAMDTMLDSELGRRVVTVR
ncbi:TetR/AcrR family transcriptional regulator [Frigoribacterium sp. RIT-PI-h]|uniref:TetR/AcrR family transcriptional regulator n=1 Tax=Frigoribacterium sp. RIT-PI-h TaxID=1690245 RepID=UPI0006B960DC|nr:TetR/AcrR family transcriptional regulator [Frigoribacterium sp. RIT-PI-h]KPG78319.1 TetR family transcriptional regulator [Frigoribacterium sp. RIT-PI-h]